jgi:EmrB/QacA subfamily drug resistance transporter
MINPQVYSGSGSPSRVEDLSRLRRVGVLVICATSLLIIGLDVTIVNVALPAIGRGFNASVSGLQWVINAYTLVLASLLILSGATADRFGRKRIFLVGLIVFASGSLLCSVAPSLAALVVFRMVQGVGASMLSPVALSIVTNTFTDARERAQAIGFWAAVFGVSMALGPVIGGLLVTGLGWRSIFWINIPVGLAAIVLTIRFVPESRAAKARRVDAVGQFLVITLLASLTFGTIEAPTRGWVSPLIVGSFILAGTSLLGLLFWERQRDVPLIDLRFFRSVPFSGATAIAAAAFACLGGFLFLNTLYLQEVRGLSPLRTGLNMLPIAAMVIVVPPISGRIVGTRGARIPLVVAGLGLTASCAMLTQINATTPFRWLFIAYVLFGIGFGFVNAPVTNAAVSGMPRAQAGVAGALVSTSRQAGQNLGVAVVGAIVAVSVGSRGFADAGIRSGFLNLAAASHAAWWVLCGCGVVVLVLGLVVTSVWARATAVRTAHELNPEFLGSSSQ